MAKQSINVGSAANSGGGDPLRLAMIKINANFTELYSELDGNQTTDVKGSVFGDDSTLLVDGVNNTIPKANIEDSANWDTAFAWGNHASAGYQPASASFIGDVEGSVFGDDSTLLVDGVNNSIPGYVSLATLKTEVAASADFAAFKVRIAAL